MAEKFRVLLAGASPSAHRQGSDPETTLLVALPSDKRIHDAGDTACHRISVIIPALDEVSCLGDHLAGLGAIGGLHERIVVDGGSRDGTMEVARSFPGVHVIAAPRGRASQMNAGARRASGEVFLFLHADTSLPADATRWIRETLADPAVVAGAFRTWTVTEQRPTWLFSPLLRLADIRSRYSRLPYGDQAMFVRAEVFWRLGGFPEQPLMEDLELSRRLRRLGRVRTVPASVRVSGRRFLSRPLYYTLLVNIFPSLYRLGVAPRLMAMLYGDPR